MPRHVWPVAILATMVAGPAVALAGSGLDWPLVAVGLVAADLGGGAGVLVAGLMTRRG